MKRTFSSWLWYLLIKAKINRTNYSQLPPLKREVSESMSKNEMAIMKQTLLQ
jgi:hypothetical protein